MKRHLFLFLILQPIAIPCLFSQIRIPQIATENSPSINQALMFSTTISYKDVEGSPYLFDEFKYGNIYYGGKYKFEQIPLRLNLYDDQLEFKRQDNIMAFGNPGRIDSIIMDGEVYIYLPRRPNFKVSGFVKLLLSNSPELFTKMKTEFIKEKISGFDGEQPRTGQFKRLEDRYYIKTRYNEIERITSVKQIIRKLGKHRSELIEYSKRERISVRDPHDLVKLVNYYHELEH